MITPADFEHFKQMRLYFSFLITPGDGMLTIAAHDRDADTGESAKITMMCMMTPAQLRRELDTLEAAAASGVVRVVVAQGYSVADLSANAAGGDKLP